MGLLYRRFKNDAYLWISAAAICLLFGFQAAHFCNADILSPAGNIARLMRIDPLFTVACLSSALACIVLLPENSKQRYVLVFCCLFCEILYAFWCRDSYTLVGHIVFSGPISFLVCLLVIAVFIVRCFSDDREKLPRILDIAGIALAMPAFYTLNDTRVNNPLVYDMMQYTADGLLGMQPSFIVTGFLRTHDYLNQLMVFIYYYLPLWMMIPQIICFRRGNKSILVSNCYGVPAVTYVIAAVLGTMCYRYFPAVGPAVFFGSNVFPYGLCPSMPIESVKAVEFPLFIQYSVVKEVSQLAICRNCMPSLHLTYILCAFFYVCNVNRFLNLVYFALSFLTLCSAFSVGGHWATDFLVAVPFVALCLGVTWNRTAKCLNYWLAAFGGLSTFGIMYLLKNHISICAAHAGVYLLGIFAVDFVSFAGVIYLLYRSRLSGG